MIQSIKGIISGLIPEQVKLRIDQKKTEKIYRQGFEAFTKNGETPDAAYMAMINLYCSTNGKFSEMEHNAHKIPTNTKAQEMDSVVGALTKHDFSDYNSTLQKDGYVNLNRKIPQHLVDAFYQFALKTPARIAPNYDKPLVYDALHPQSEIYRFTMNDLVNNPAIQELIMDPALIQIARDYLNCEPIFDFPAMWWSTAFLKEASSEAAQLYHFDMDRLKWLKIFIYLNDVTEENGPHRYIRGSHKIGAKPDHLLKRGYVRIPDEDLKEHYSKNDFVEVCASAGSVFAGDTKCWHKGTPLQKGDRLVLEFEYTGCMFGVNHPKFELESPNEKFKKFCLDNKIYSSNFRIKS